MLLAQSPAPAADLLVLAFVAGFAVATLVFWAATTHAPPHQPTGRIEHRRAPIHGVPRLPGVPGLRRVPRIHCGNATESSVQRRTIARGNAFGIGRKPPPRRRNRTGRGAHRRARVGLRRYRGRPLEAVSGKSRGGFRQGPGTDRTAAHRLRAATGPMAQNPYADPSVRRPPGRRLLTKTGGALRTYEPPRWVRHMWIPHWSMPGVLLFPVEELPG